MPDILLYLIRDLLRIGDKASSINEVLITCKWESMKCSAIRTLGILRSFDKDLVGE